MKSLKSVRAFALCAAVSTTFVFSSTASAQASHGGAHGGGAPATSAAGAASAKSGAAMDFMTVMKESNLQMTSMPMTGKTDVDFAMMMRMHHEAGVKMAEIEVRDGKDAKMRDQAKKIISAQKKEIAELDAFLAKNGHDMSKMKR